MGLLGSERGMSLTGSCFDHSVPNLWHYLGRLWNLWDMASGWHMEAAGL